PTITGAQILAGTQISGDTSDNTDFADSGTVPLSDCGAGSAPDEWYRIEIGAATGTISIDVDACLPGTTYDSKIFLLDTTATVIDCADDGCGQVGGPSMLVNVALAPGTYDLAIDGFVTSSGPYAAELREFVPISCFLDPPCDGSPEGEPCDQVAEDTTNGGCNSTPNVFGEIEQGQVICGTLWADGGSRDTDWYAFSIGVLQGMDFELRAEPDTVAFLAEMSAGGACPVVGIPDGTPAFSGDCNSRNNLGLGYVLEPGDYILFVSAGTETGGGVFDGFPCPDGTTTNNAYELTFGFACDHLCLPCPWDLSENNQVDFADLLQIISHWGPCPTG
ncbi:MAG: PPC domain-containing protein, partial [Planctomycetota bacterium]